MSPSGRAADLGAIALERTRLSIGKQNTLLINSNKIAGELWKDEKVAHLESIVVAKKEALEYLSTERDRILKLSHEEAVKQLIHANKIENTMRVINGIQDNGLFEVRP